MNEFMDQISSSIFIDLVSKEANPTYERLRTLAALSMTATGHYMEARAACIRATQAATREPF